jgi:NADH:ubiquinone oxidoreductase subunit E
VIQTLTRFASGNVATLIYYSLQRNFIATSPRSRPYAAFSRRCCLRRMSLLGRLLRQPVIASKASMLARSPLARPSPVLARCAGTFLHHERPDNSVDTPFEFDEESEKEIAFTLSKYPDTLQGKQSGIMPLLWIVQQQLDKAHGTIKPKYADEGATPFPKSQGGGGWVPISAMHKIAERLGCSHMDVYEVATFFTIYNREKLGKFHIQLCATTPCMVCGAYDIMCARATACAPRPPHVVRVACEPRARRRRTHTFSPHLRCGHCRGVLAARITLLTLTCGVRLLARAGTLSRRTWASRVARRVLTVSSR